MKTQEAQIGIREGEDWEVRTPEQDVLTRLPRCLTDDQVIAIVEFVMKTEREAFNEGLSIGTGAAKAEQEQIERSLRDRIQTLDGHNSMLAEKVENLLNGVAENVDH